MQPHGAEKYNPALTASPSDTILPERLQPAMCTIITSPPSSPRAPDSQSEIPGVLDVVVGLLLVERHSFSAIHPPG